MIQTQTLPKTRRPDPADHPSTPYTPAAPCAPDTPPPEQKVHTGLEAVQPGPRPLRRLGVWGGSWVAIFGLREAQAKSSGT